jgi:hypothetical protein
MFANTLTVNVNGADRVLTRVNQDGFSSAYRYRDAALNLDLAIRHSDRPTSGKTGIRTERHNVELKATTFTVVDGVTVSTQSKAYFTVENETGASATTPLNLLAALNTVFIASAGVPDRLLQWES